MNIKWLLRSQNKSNALQQPTENGSFTRNLTSWSQWSVLIRLVLLTEHKVLHCSAMNEVYRCLVAGQLYPSCRFSSADCRCFQVANPCQAIHSTAFVHHTAFTDRDLSESHLHVKFSWFCLIFLLILFWSWQFPK